MKLSLIIEAEFTRRNFLKSMAGAAAALSGNAPIAQAVAKNTIGAQAVNKLIPQWERFRDFPWGVFTIFTGTDATRYEPALIDQFKSVASAANIAKQIGYGDIKFGVDKWDGDAIFVNNLLPDIYSEIERKANAGEDIKIAGKLYDIVDDEDSFSLHPREGELQGWINIPKYGSAPKTHHFNTGQLRPVGDDPIKTWWDNYGVHIDVEIDEAAKEVIKNHNLDTSRHEKRFAEYEQKHREQLEREQQREREKLKHDNEMMRWADDGGRVAESFLRRLNRSLQKIHN